MLRLFGTRLNQQKPRADWGHRLTEGSIMLGLSVLSPIWPLFNAWVLPVAARQVDLPAQNKLAAMVMLNQQLLHHPQLADALFGPLLGLLAVAFGYLLLCGWLSRWLARQVWTGFVAR